jgi:molybdopterin-binding protein
MIDSVAYSTPRPGTVRQIAMGRSCAAIKLELAGGKIVNTHVTCSLARRMRLKEGKSVMATFEANKVLITAM